MTKLVIALSFLISYQVYAKPVVEKQSSNYVLILGGGFYNQQ